jgi:hypothetical protein
VARQVPRSTPPGRCAVNSCTCGALLLYVTRDQLGLLEQLPVVVPELAVVLNHLGFCPHEMRVDRYGRPAFDDPFPPGSLDPVLRLADHLPVRVMFSGQYALSREAPPYRDLDATVRGDTVSRVSRPEPAGGATIGLAPPRPIHVTALCVKAGAVTVLGRTLARRPQRAWARRPRRGLLFEGAVAPRPRFGCRRCSYSSNPAASDASSEARRLPALLRSSNVPASRA